MQYASAVFMILSFVYPGHDASCPYIIAFIGVEFIRPVFSGFDESNPYSTPTLILPPQGGGEI
jgi:hypothetical protein